MSIYTYTCQHCGHYQERLTALGRDTIHCEKCGKIINRDTVYPFTAVYSGAGWTKKKER